MKKNTNDINLKTAKRDRFLPSIIFYIVVGTCLTLGAVAVVILLIFTIKQLRNGGESISSLLIGLATSILSTGILANAFGTYNFSQITSSRKDQELKRQVVCDAIQEFNDNYLSAYNFARTIALEARHSLKKAKLKVKPSLELQEDAVKDFEKDFDNPDEYINAIITKCSVYLISESSTFSKDYMSHILKVLDENEKEYKVDKNTVGCSIVLNLYRERRIKVLNLFENMSIKYMNNMLDRILFDAQFKDIILEAAKVFYYDIYKNEGTKSYPSLLMLCKQYEN